MSLAIAERQQAVGSPSLRVHGDALASEAVDLLGPSEETLLPAEDDDDDDWDSPVFAAVSPSVRRSHDPLSPSLFAGVDVRPPPPPGMRLVRVKTRVIAFKRAMCKRPSRAARPNEPSARAKDTSKRIVVQHEAELKSSGRSRLAADDFQRYRMNASSGGKTHCVVAVCTKEQARINHIAQLKAKTVETHNNEASWLLWGNTAEQVWSAALLLISFFGALTVSVCACLLFGSSATTASPNRRCVQMR